jgi:transposase-like protein
MNKSDKLLFWKKQLADCSRSGLSQKAYCSQQGLKPATFSYWRKQLRSSDAACGKLIRLPLSTSSHSVRITVSGLQLEVPVTLLEQVLPIVLRHQQVGG